MNQQQLLDRAIAVDKHIPSAVHMPVSGLTFWSAANAGMAKTGVGLVGKLATKPGWDELQTVLGPDSYDATEAGALSLTAAAVTTSIDLAAAAALRLAGALPSGEPFRERRYRQLLARWSVLSRSLPPRRGKAGVWEFSMSTLGNRRYRRLLRTRCPALGGWVTGVRGSAEWDLLKKCRNQVVHSTVPRSVVYGSSGAARLPSSEVKIDGKDHPIDVLVQTFSAFGETTFGRFSDAVLVDFPNRVR